jgi:hypothetical protein
MNLGTFGEHLGQSESPSSPPSEDAHATSPDALTVSLDRMAGYLQAVEMEARRMDTETDRLKLRVLALQEALERSLMANEDMRMSVLEDEMELVGEWGDQRDERYEGKKGICRCMGLLF